MAKVAISCQFAAVHCDTDSAPNSVPSDSGWGGSPPPPPRMSWGGHITTSPPLACPWGVITSPPPPPRMSWGGSHHHLPPPHVMRGGHITTSPPLACHGGGHITTSPPRTSCGGVTSPPPPPSHVMGGVTSPPSPLPRTSWGGSHHHLPPPRMSWGGHITIVGWSLCKPSPKVSFDLARIKIGTNLGLGWPSRSHLSCDTVAAYVDRYIYVYIFI